MFQREKDILDAIAGRLSKDRGIRKVIAYGSRVRGDNSGESDLDVLVIVDRKTRDRREKILDAFYAYELKTDLSFSVSIHSQEELAVNERLGSPFFKTIAKEGIVFYDAQRSREKGTLKIPA